MYKIVYHFFAEIEARGMADTCNPEMHIDKNPCKSISTAPSFEVYLKQCEAKGN